MLDEFLRKKTGLSRAYYELQRYKQVNKLKIEYHQNMPKY